MEKSFEENKPPEITKTDTNTIELKEVDNASDTVKSSKEKSNEMDTVDQGCVKCEPKTLQMQQSVSLSMSSDEDETEQAISLNMNKKSSNMHKGLMDFALLTANANQLRFLITYNSGEKTFIISATLIILSLIIQVAVGIGMICKRQMKRKGKRSKADKVSSLVVCGIFCLAVLNVLVISFTTTSSVTAPA